MERSYQGFGQRIRTVLDTVDGRIGASTEMLAALGHQTLDLFIAEAQQAAGGEHAGDCQSFRFGHRLEPLMRASGTKTTDGEAALEESAAGQADGEPAIAPPDASDSRLADALRQLLPQISGGSSPEVVLISDGRVRGTESVERLAELFGDAAVPLHAVPVGETSGSGRSAVTVWPKASRRLWRRCR